MLSPDTPLGANVPSEGCALSVGTRIGWDSWLKAPEASGRCEAGIALTRMRPPPTSAGDRLAEFLFGAREDGVYA